MRSLYSTVSITRPPVERFQHGSCQPLPEVVRHPGWHILDIYSARVSTNCVEPFGSEDDQPAIGDRWYSAWRLTISLEQHRKSVIICTVRFAVRCSWAVLAAVGVNDDAEDSRAVTEA